MSAPSVRNRMINRTMMIEKIMALLPSFSDHVLETLLEVVEEVAAQRSNVFVDYDEFHQALRAARFTSRMALQAWGVLVHEHRLAEAEAARVANPEAGWSYVERPSPEKRVSMSIPLHFLRGIAERPRQLSEPIWAFLQEWRNLIGD